MAFSAQGISVPKAFKKEGAKPKYQQPQDRLVTVESYDLARASVLVVDSGNRKFSVSVSKDAIARSISNEKERTAAGPIAQWSGYAVDERMQTAIPVGSKMILERTTMGKSSKIGSETIYNLEASWIRNVTEPAPNKTFEGLFSVSAYQGKIVAVQDWNEQAISADNKEAVKAIADELTANYKAIVDDKEFRPGLGIQFRVIVPGETAKDPLVAIDTTPAFDWISGVKDTAGRTIQDGHPVNGSKFLELLDQYTNEYVNVKFAEYPNKKIEILNYNNYMAAKLSAKMVLPESQYHPLNKLASTETKLALDDEAPTKMKNVAVKGILELTADGIDKIKKEFFPRNMAKALHANGLIGNVQSWVRSSDGQKVVPHQGLKVAHTKEEKDDNDSGMPTGAPTSSVSSYAAPMATPEADDPFLGADAAFGDVQVTPAVVAPVVATPAPTPVAAPAAPATEAKPAAPAAAASSARRRTI